MLPIVLNEAAVNIGLVGEGDAFTRRQTMLADALPVIRASNPTRMIMVGPASWNNLNHLDRLTLPKDDRLIVTFHYYSPFEFTQLMSRVSAAMSRR